MNSVFFTRVSEKQIYIRFIQHIAPGAVSSSGSSFFAQRQTRKLNASDTRGTREWLVMKRKGLWEGEKWEAKRCLAHIPLPAFLCVEIFIKGDDVWVWGRHKTLVRYFNERLTCYQEETLSLNGVTSEKETTHTPPPPLHSKFVSSLLSTGSSNSGTTLHGGG